MAGDLITLDVRTRGDWRRWLAKHHASSPGIWLIRHKQHAGVESMPYGDVVSEALCFGWIDSLIKRLDEKTREKRIRESIELLAAGEEARVEVNHAEHRTSCLSTPSSRRA